MTAIGLYWEEWEVGREWTTGGRTMTEAAIELYAALSGDFNPLHTDEEYAKQTPFGTRIAHGPLVYVLAAGLLYRLHLYDDTLVALAGLDEMRFTAPVRAGDTIHVRTRVIDRRPTSKPDRGLVKREVVVVNQHDATVMRVVQALLIRRRPTPVLVPVIPPA